LRLTRIKYDFIIIGAGIVGCMIARSLARYKLKILLIDKDSDVGTGSSSANTAIIHASYNPVPGTAKARMNITGNKMWGPLSGELGFTFKRNGGYVVAIGDQEQKSLEDLRQRAVRNGINNIVAISGDSMRQREPDINPAVSGALWIPDIGICDPFAAVISAAENAVENGVTLLLNTLFQDFVFEKSRIVGIRTNRGVFHSRWVVNAAGLYSDEVMHRAGLRPEFKISPVKGEYHILDNVEIDIRNVIFPVPSPDSKGILVTTTTHGNTIVGPNAQDSPDKEDRSNTREGLEKVWQGAMKLIPGLKRRSVIASFAGLRATGNARCLDPEVNYQHDFILEIPRDIQGLVNLGGIDSPGLTSAPAIAQYVIELLKDAGEALEVRSDWNPLRIARPRFRDLPPDEREKLILADSRYARIICRCENITEGEVLAEIHSPVPAVTYDGIKRRTWLGTGRCQGAFDEPRIVKLLADELKVKPEEITKKGPGSEFLIRPTKDI
jgi:glycerol-3-phosphate dehydrogenase